MSSQPADDELRQLRLAISDPGAFVQRAGGHTESLPSWQSRAVLAAGWRPMEDARYRGLALVVAELLADCEREYVAAINAVLGAPDDCSADADRWRGHAEARRSMAEDLRRLTGRPAVTYGSAEWRTANGVYTPEQVAAFSKAGD